MAKLTEPAPNFHTPEDEINGVEKIKRDSHGVRGNMHADFRDFETGSIEEDSLQLAKSYGIYLEYNRDKKGKDKDYIYMIRVSIPGGGGFDFQQWSALDEAARKYAINPDLGDMPSLRVTNRQNVQFHWVRKPDVIPLVQHIVKSGCSTINGCGDNFRNVMGCPLSAYSKVFNASETAHRIAAYFQLPNAPYIEIFEVDPTYVRQPGDDKRYKYGPKLLNRKFKVGVGAVHQNPDTGAWENDNCVEMRTNEIGIAPMLDSKTETVDRFFLYIGGGQGEKNGQPTAALLGMPFGIVARDDLMPTLHGIVATHDEWGDRQNRQWARMKYLVRGKGVEWYRQQVRDRGGNFEDPTEPFDPGPRQLHHGWHTQPTNGKLAFGAYIENGRLVDGVNGKLLTMVRDTLEKYPDVRLMTTPNQDLLFTEIAPDAKDDFEAGLREYGWGERNGKAYSQLRLKSGACVALPTCALAYTDSERFEPQLVDELEKRGYGDMAEAIGITGCERQCFRPSTKTIGLVGQGPDMYSIRLGGSEDARHQGHALIEDGQWHLRRIPRDRVADVIATLFDHYKQDKQDGEDLGAFIRRIGAADVIARLKADDRAADLFEKTYDAPYVPEPSLT